VLLFTTELTWKKIPFKWRRDLPFNLVCSETKVAMGGDDTADIMSEIIMRMAHDSECSVDHKRRTPCCHLGPAPERADLGQVSGTGTERIPPAHGDAYRLSTDKTLAEGDMRNNAKDFLNIGKNNTSMQFSLYASSPFSLDTTMRHRPPMLHYQ
jgi:hypothetical protein